MLLPVVPVINVSAPAPPVIVLAPVLAPVTMFVPSPNDNTLANAPVFKTILSAPVPPV